MKIIGLPLVTILFLTFITTSCKKDDIKCSYNSEFCGFVSSGEYNKTGALVNDYLNGLNNNLSDDDKLERLKDWLKCKSCVENVEIICNSCIYTNPPQSELKILFRINGQQTEKVLDIIMDEPLKFRTYHD